MSIQKALISDDCADEESAADGCDNDLSNRTRREMSECLGLANWRHVSQG